jgi:hypothetical protein
MLGKLGKYLEGSPVRSGTITNERQAPGIEDTNSVAAVECGMLDFRWAP